MMWWGDGWSAGWGGAWAGMMLVHALWWIFIVFAFVGFIRWLVSGDAGGRRFREDRAMDVLRERYARGEIGKEEFEERRQYLSAKGRR